MALYSLIVLMCRIGIYWLTHSLCNCFTHTHTSGLVTVALLIIMLSFVQLLLLRLTATAADGTPQQITIMSFEL